MNNISFEVFPPKKEGDFDSAFTVVKELAAMEPEFISVTYGAGGSHSKKTLEIASYIQNELHVPAIAHLTCVGSTRRQISSLCEEFAAHHISRVLALRGDRPRDMTDEQFDAREFTYASDLIRYVGQNTKLQMTAACYPEKHYEAMSFEEDLLHMKEKQDAGADMFITQMFFDNDFFYAFRDKAHSMGITASIHAGIMPITAAKQLGTSVALSGSSVPGRLADLIALYGDRPEEMYKAGIDYAVRQIQNLQEHGVDGIHIYTMNKPAIAGEIISKL